MSETTEQTTDEGGTNDVRADLQAELEKLKAKNKELIAEKQKAKQLAQEAQDAADEAAQQAAERTGDIDAFKAAAAKELQKLQAKYDALDSDLRTVRVDNEIARAIADGNVRPEMVRAVTAMMKAEVTYADGIATIDGKPVADHVADYLGGKDGAHFVRAADNSGGGATGSASKAAKVQLDKPFSLTEYGVLKASDPASAAAWATQSGNGYLNDLN